MAYSSARWVSPSPNYASQSALPSPCLTDGSGEQILEHISAAIHGPEDRDQSHTAQLSAVRWFPADGRQTTATAGRRRSGPGACMALDHTQASAEADVHEMVDLKAKNRLAQRKVRQRQREREQAKAQELKEAIQRLEVMTLERQQLQQRNTELEAAVCMNAFQVRRATPINEIFQSPISETILRAQDMYQARTGLLQSPESAARQLPEVVMGCRFPYPANFDEVSFRLMNGERYVWDSKSIKQLNLTQILKIWEEIVNSAAMLLARANGDSESPAGRELQELVVGALTFRCSLHVHSWQVKNKAAVTRMGQCPSHDDPEHPQFDWPRILAAMRLQPWQKQKLLSFRSQYMRTWQQLKVERKDLQRSLQASSVTDAHSSSSGQLGQQIALHDLTDRLQSLWTKTHSSLTPYLWAAWTEVMDHMQVAQFLVQSYPWMPDSLQLVYQLAQEAGLSNAEDGLNACVNWRHTASSFPTPLPTTQEEQQQPGNQTDQIEVYHC